MKPATPIFLSLLLALTACGEKPESVSTPTAADAAAFVADAEQRLATSYEELARASWLANTYIIDDSQFIEALAAERFSALSVELAKQAAQYNALTLDPTVRRKLDQLRHLLDFPPPSDASLSKELATIGSSLQATYGQGKYCPPTADKEAGCLGIDDINEIMSSSRDPEQLKQLWTGWHAISPPMRSDYVRQVEIANQGARELGYDNLTQMWQSKYDMPAADFAADIDRQWQRVKPLYDALHCHVRAKLHETYGDDVLADNGPIPAHLLGNMWAQTWGDVYPLVKPADADRGYDLNALLKKANPSAEEMTRTAEHFFVSLGLEPLPETFWKNSMLTKPRDREVVCHASAWTMDGKEDLRIKMCTRANETDFITLHHELGHIFYDRAYNHHSFLFQRGANDGFHEALGDTITLSMTPAYLTQIKLLEQEPASDDIGILLAMALDKIAFLPFALVVDQWRWQVFSGELPPERYNEGWWALREKLQGVKAPVERSEADFDAGAKFHIPGNTPYMRYFLAFIQQFQFHRALCETAGFEGPLHRCSIYNNKAAGEKLQAMMALGTSQPWPVAMQALTGQPDLDAAAILDYFAPLKVWLDEQNKNRQCGW